MRKSRRFGRTIFLATVFGVLFCGSGRLQAGLVLTQAGIDQGFSLSTFASGFPTAQTIGPLGMAFTAGGGVLVADAPGNVRLFPTDTDGQNAAQVPVASNYGGFNALGLARVGNNFYLTQQAAGTVVQINPDGTFRQTIATGLYQATGVVANPVNGLLYVSTSLGGHDQVFSVDPAAKTATLFLNATLDGMIVSPDGKTLYGAGPDDGLIVGYDTATGAQVFQSGPVSGGVDGLALGTGTLAGDLFVNTNGGAVVEINAATGLTTAIAQGGSRGDFVSADPNNTSLLLTQTDSIVRLTPPPGASFTNPGTGNLASVPEPSSLALLGVAAAALAGWRWRQRRKHLT